MVVYKVGDIVDGAVTLRPAGPFKVSDTAAILTNLPASTEPCPGPDLHLPVVIGKGEFARVVDIPLQPFVGVCDQNEPVCIADERLVIFRGRLFAPEWTPRNAAEREEVILRVKKAVYSEAAELEGIRATVRNFETAMQFAKSGPSRQPIPSSVQVAVWARDGGQCVACGATSDLHFDHIIPVAKGGGTSESNIQILCRTCNLKKSDRIGG